MGLQSAEGGGGGGLRWLHCWNWFGHWVKTVWRAEKRRWWQSGRLLSAVHLQLIFRTASQLCTCPPWWERSGGWGGRYSFHNLSSFCFRDSHRSRSESGWFSWPQAALDEDFCFGEEGLFFLLVLSTQVYPFFFLPLFSHCRCLPWWPRVSELHLHTTKNVKLSCTLPVKKRQKGVESVALSTGNVATALWLQRCFAFVWPCQDIAFAKYSEQLPCNGRCWWTISFLCSSV